jgi:hypothetical protein
LGEGDAGLVMAVEHAHHGRCIVTVGTVAGHANTLAKPGFFGECPPRWCCVRLR